MNRNFAYVILILLFSFITHSVFAETAASDMLLEKVNLNQLLGYAHENNPRIQAARQNWKSIMESYRVQTGYPDPQIMFTYFTDPIETRLGPQDWSANISQAIPFPGKLSKKGDMIENDFNIARLKLDQTTREVLLAVQESYYELFYISKAQSIASQNRRLIDHLRKIAETSHSDNKSTLFDVMKAQSQVGQLEYDQMLLADLAQTEVAKLNGLLNRKPDAKIGQYELPQGSGITYGLNELYAIAESHSEKIQIARQKIKKSQNKMDLAKYEYLPNFKLGLFYASIGDPDVPKPPDDAGQDAIGIQAGMTVPIWFGKNNGRLGQARAELSKNKSLQRETINQTRVKIRYLYFRYKNSQRIVDLYQNNLLPQATKSMKIAETWFQEGESSFTDFIETQATFYNFQLALARAQADQGKFLARLEAIVGQAITTGKKSLENKGAK